MPSAGILVIIEIKIVEAVPFGTYLILEGFSEARVSPDIQPDQALRLHGRA